MKRAITTILLALAASGQASWFDLGVGLTVKFGLLLNSFFSVPLTIENAKKENWIKATQLDDVPKLYKELEMYCFECDGPICALYEPHSGYIAGLQFGLNKDYITDNAYDLVENGFKEWTWTCDGVCRTLYTIRQYYMTAEYLSKSAEDRKHSYNTKKILQNGVVVTDGPGGLQELFSDNRSKMEAEGTMTKQNCVPLMGDHYYYNMTETLECSAKTLYPWFLLVDDQQVIGCAMMSFLKVNKQSGRRNWFEQPAEAAVKYIVPRGPQCLYDLAKNPGAHTAHVWTGDSIDPAPAMDRLALSGYRYANQIGDEIKKLISG